MRVRIELLQTRSEIRLIWFSDEYAPIKAAKALRKGKRITEIEHLYAIPDSKAVVTTKDVETTMVAVPNSSLPELTSAFFESNFFRRFQVQRKYMLTYKLRI